MWSATFNEGKDVTIPVYNNVDAEQLPSSFRYVTEPVYANERTDLVAKTPRKLGCRLYLKKTVAKGWGVHAAVAIAQGSFICEYIGEMITSAEAKKRLEHYDDLNQGHALLVLREILPSGACLRTNIDATYIGNVARFFNHSCDGGNLVADIERVTGALVPVVGFYARHNIIENEELTFAYGQTAEKEGHQTRRRPCACGALSCYGFLPGTDTR